MLAYTDHSENICPSAIRKKQYTWRTAIVWILGFGSHAMHPIAVRCYASMAAMAPFMAEMTA